MNIILLIHTKTERDGGSEREMESERVGGDEGGTEEEGGSRHVMLKSVE